MGRRPAMPLPERRKYERNRRALRRDEEPCHLCGRPIDYELKSPHPGSFTADHVVPLSQGGTNDLDNLRAAHFGHNSARGEGGRKLSTKDDRSATW